VSSSDDATYIQIDLDLDEQSILQDGIDAFASTIPGWRYRASSPEAGLLGAAARLAADQRLALITVLDSIFVAYGENVLNFPRGRAVRARATVTITLNGAAPVGGFPIDAGTTFSLPASDGSQQPFTLDFGVVIPAGSTTINAPATAVTAGSVANELAGTATLQTAILSVSGISVLSLSVGAATTGGADEQTISDYRNKLTKRAQLQAETPILPNDFAAIATLNPNVYRALAIDLYRPSDNTSGHPEERAVILQGFDGGPVSTQTLSDVDTDLQNRREVNDIVNTAQVEVVSIAFAATVTKRVGALDADVSAAVDAAVKAWANPAAWGAPQQAGDPAWRIVDTVRLNDFLAVVRSAEGVAYVESGTIAGSATDHALGRPYRVPTVTGTVAVTIH
jgi:hypothetical protein